MPFPLHAIQTRLTVSFFGRSPGASHVRGAGQLDLRARAAALSGGDYLFPGRIHDSPHLSTREYARLVHRWIRAIGLDDAAYGTHTMRRTKASLIDRRTKNLRAVQLLLVHTKLASTVRYLGIEVDEALEMAEQTNVCGDVGRTASGRCPATCCIHHRAARDAKTVVPQ